ncbi:hypothetical protein GGX14DRAFT_651037 [Mycena pura]|uniref:Uncharacterized protein n=1 Tax=Mycena pura TaxID=153505 RepID=A0AAD7E2Y9_9AGAR|nr:hypothetical protein GGX14DRAFT_651037 [Mycena pura]
MAEPEYDASGVMNILSAAAQPQMHICGTANCYPHADYLKRSPKKGGRTRGNGSSQTLPHQTAFERVADLLQEMLMNMLKVAEDEPGNAHPALEGLDAGQAASAWYSQLQMHPHAKILAMLAVKIFSICVNSMADERTNSTITWLNSPQRGRQDIQTLRDMIQIGKYYNVAGRVSVYRPAVKFRKIDAAALKAVQKLAADSDDSEDEWDEDDEGEEAGRKRKAHIRKIVSDDEDSEGEGDDEDGEGTDADAEKEVVFFFDRDIDPNSAALRDLLALESEEPEPEMSQREKHKSVEVKKTTTAELDWSQIRRGGSKS